MAAASVSHPRVVARWRAPDDDDDRYLGCSPPGPPQDLSMDLLLDAASHRALFKLKLPVGLRALQRRESMSRLDVQWDAVVLQLVRDTLTRRVRCKSTPDFLALRLVLKSAGSAFRPPYVAALTSKTKPWIRVLDLFRSLSAATELTLFLARHDAPAARLDTLAGLLRTTELRSIPGEVESLYHGQGGTEIAWPPPPPPSMPEHPPGSPPSYDELALSSPSRRAAGEPSRKRARGAEEGKASLPPSLRLEVSRLADAVASLEGDLPARVAALERQQERDQSRLADLVAEAAQRVKKELKTELEALLEQQLEEQWEHYEEGAVERLSEARDEVSEDIECKIDDRLLDIKAELSDALEEKMQDIEESIRREIEDESLEAVLRWRR
ncbi:hypothetical protein SLS56_012012 [Neofusicoccum ribis]|uniref:Uncharacterized protein n=1 Tax=Neofusicoccum ribis TaxID=45134 RepID=A0ABR3SA07_9PEZI